MELFPRILLVGLVLTCFANAISSDLARRSSTASAPPWRGSGVLSYVSSEEAYETPTPSPDKHSSIEPYSFYDTWDPITKISESSTTPRPQYSTIVNVRTTTWVLSRSTTVTSIIFETYYSTLTDMESSAEAETVTVTEMASSSSSSGSCTTASGYASVYGNGCSSSSSSSYLSSSSSSSSSSDMTTITWSPEVTAYPLPSSSDDGRASPASTSTTSSASTTTTTTTKGNETPPVVTGGGGSPPQAADARALGAVVALLAVLV